MAFSQDWEMITGMLFAKGENPEFADDSFNRKLGTLLCVMHPTNSYGWDESRSILYAAGLGAHAYKLKLKESPRCER